MDDKQCILVIIGADEWGKKEVIALADGYRESTQSWREVLLDLKQRGLSKPPELAIGDGALGFWSALREVFGDTKSQRCWVHKTMNVLNSLPKSVQPKAKGQLHDIWQAETKEDAAKAFDFFERAYGVKYEKAVENWSKIARSYWLSTTFLPSIGNTSEPPTPSRASLPLYDIAPAKPKAA